MSEWLTDAEQRTWRTVLQMHAQLISALAQNLKSDSNMSISDYEVMAILSEAPQQVLRARDLRSELAWEKSRLAHHIGRMERRGYVQREVCHEDRRAPLVRLTETGLAAIRAAAPTHVTRVRALFFDALTPEQTQALREAADAVLENIDRHAAEARQPEA